MTTALSRCFTQTSPARTNSLGLTGPAIQISGRSTFIKQPQRCHY
jgi:hypothetical protein